MKVDHPFQFDANHCENCSASPHGWHGNYCVKPLAEGRVAGGSYALGATVLECGTYTWKVRNRGKEEWEVLISLVFSLIFHYNCL